MNPEKPNRMPVRQREDRWEVLIAEKDAWVLCDSEEDALALALTPVLEYESLERSRTGPGFADELDRTADAMDLHRFGFGSRFFR